MGEEERWHDITMAEKFKVKDGAVKLEEGAKFKEGMMWKMKCEEDERECTDQLIMEPR